MVQTLFKSIIKNHSLQILLRLNFVGYKLQIKGPISQKKLGRTITIRKNFEGISPNSMDRDSKIAKGILFTKLGIIGIKLGIA